MSSPKAIRKRYGCLAARSARSGRGDGVTTLTFKSYRSHRGQSSGSGGYQTRSCQQIIQDWRTSV